MHNNGLLAGFIIDFNFGFGAYINLATPGMISLAYTFSTVDNTCGGEIRPGQMLHQSADVQYWFINQGNTGIDHFAQIMRWNISRHAHGNTAGAID
ncbi:Uncharacterised protein [Candidatus Venteria ishoeyi]|uniref:Uncharacterized protein n=1 Tax=Candidatus Venteria ishoeyi TaxID=1899563 RepID=A0A1H6F914_9GAMM|nr:Uncharacterised protein [Candidatus Venteria ishoeyi]